MVSSLSFERLANVLSTNRLAAILHAHPTTSISTLGLALALPFAISDYRLFISYGPSGVPHNAIGWLISTLMRPLGREQRSSDVYKDKKLPFADEPGYLPADFPPPRRPERPNLGPHPIPQRQLDQLPDADVRQKLIERFAALGTKAEQKGLVEVRQSLFEGHHTALFVSKTRDWHALARQTRGEISHVHAGLDGSIHVVLHPADCNKLFETGWAQRHAFSGVGAIKLLVGASLPVNYVLCYAPRDEAELDIALAIVKASIQFMARTRESLE
ncbi:hypothetical protein K458DRAFT_394676 [Lentithecium fluviatile CBS 122367]|uniref:Luciferase domain-containing protein n=1 Tax=Lentithecium fluviatile CBS 122367 TaxID=1168545 RepID=A0A6G1IKF3_9PLEO|nr:hypothetical protein K458DRAFT_394676 [Lentithecium fluviatile CBS 122367]